MRLIIPCAGLGSRMKMPANQSKELLLYNGKPLIENALELAKYFQISPLVITRKEKTDLIQYCAERGIETLIIEVQGEWASTILQSKDYWDEDNILILPDTIFDYGVNAFRDIEQGLSLGNNAVFALHNVPDRQNWGIVSQYTVTEKPAESGPGLAWGLIGFKKKYGELLFYYMQRKNNPLNLRDCGFTYLKNFKDVTRTGKLE